MLDSLDGSLPVRHIMCFAEPVIGNQLIIPDLRMEGHYEMTAGVSVRLSVCRVHRSNASTERPRKHKIVRMEAYHTGQVIGSQNVKA